MKWIVGLCAVAVAVGLVATISIPAQTMPLDEAVLRLFPAETNGIASIDAAALRNAPLVQDLLRQLPTYPEHMRRFIAATGFHPEQDVNKVTVARVSADHFVAIVDAHYDHFKAQLFMEDEHVPNELFLGRVLYQFMADEQVADTYRRPSMSFSFIDNWILIGHTEAVKQVIDRMAAPAPNALQNAELMALIRKIDSGNQVWAAGKLDPAMFGAVALPRLPKIGDLVREVNGVTYQMHLDRDIRAKATATFSGPEPARNAADLLRGLLGMVQLGVGPQGTGPQGRDRAVLDLLSRARIDNVDTAVIIQATVPGELIETAK